MAGRRPFLPREVPTRPASRPSVSAVPAPVSMNLGGRPKENVKAAEVVGSRSGDRTTGAPAPHGHSSAAAARVGPPGRDLEVPFPSCPFPWEGPLCEVWTDGSLQFRFVLTQESQLLANVIPVGGNEELAPDILKVRLFCVPGAGRTAGAGGSQRCRRLAPDAPGSLGTRSGADALAFPWESPTRSECPGGAARPAYRVPVTASAVAEG